MVPFLSLCCYHHIWIHTSQLFIQGMPATRALHIFDPPLKDEGSTNQIHSEKGLFFKYMSTIRELQIHAPVITLQVFLIARVVPNQWRFLKPQPPQVLGCDSTSHFARRKTALSLLPWIEKNESVLPICSYLWIPVSIIPKFVFPKNLKCSETAVFDLCFLSASLSHPQSICRLLRSLLNLQTLGLFKRP